MQWAMTSVWRAVGSAHHSPTKSGQQTTEIAINSLWLTEFFYVSAITKNEHLPTEKSDAGASELNGFYEICGCIQWRMGTKCITSKKSRKWNDKMRKMQRSHTKQKKKGKEEEKKVKKKL